MRRDLPAYIRAKGPKDPKAPGGRKYLYFEKNGVRVRIHGKPGTPEFAVTYARLLAGDRAIGAEEYDIHSLRYAAASEIAALPGMTADHVKAITGHASAKMVVRYAGKAEQRARAKEVQEKRK